MIHRWLTTADEVDESSRAQLVRCWRDVSNAGGAVGFPRPPVSEGEVSVAVDALLARLRPGLEELLVVADEADPDVVVGWLVLVGNESALTRHWARVLRVQSAPAARGRGVGRTLMAEVARRAREDRGLAQLHLELRSGMGLEAFYSALGWRVVGTWPGALRVGGGDVRDEVLMVLDLT